MLNNEVPEDAAVVGVDVEQELSHLLVQQRVLHLAQALNNRISQNYRCM